jgi:glutaredoxin-like protein
MAMMDKGTAEKVKEALSGMKADVHLLLFTDRERCTLCNETREILEELASLAPKLTLEVKDIVEDKDVADGHRVEMTPATLVLRGTKEANERTGIRFLGIPAGYEFTSLIDAIVTVSNGEDAISKEGVEVLRGLKKDVHIQVFVTPTCPYCPRAVVLAHHMALHSDRVTADMVEAQEFPELAMRYKVMGVPRTVINGTLHQEGAAPERMIIELIKKA